MTTTVLSHMADQLHGNDIQAIRDFAFDAPYEWRRVLLALAEVAEAADGAPAEKIEAREEELEELQAELETVRSTAEKMMRVLEEQIRHFREAMDSKSQTFKGVTEAFDDFEKELNTQLDETKKAMGAIE